MDFNYTCLTCHVSFQNYNLQRSHYKTDWHRYNLKRKVAELPPITTEQFNSLVLQQRDKDNVENTSTSVHCTSCQKYFNSEKSHDNHLNSKKHKLNISKSNTEKNASTLTGSSKIAVIPKSKTDNENVELNNSENDNENVELNNSEIIYKLMAEYEELELEEREEEVNVYKVANNECLFCPHRSASMLKNLKHMTVAHSFSIPDAEYVNDLNGLIVYLNEKVSIGWMCLWCNDKGKSFNSKVAVQQHMRAKGHCKMFVEGDAFIEYTDYYDYSESYPNELIYTSDVFHPEVIDDSGFELVLPSGAIIGHRSLMRYYRQNIAPNQRVVPQKKTHRAFAQYRALGCTATQREQAARMVRDVVSMRKMQSKYNTKLATKSNKLQKHFRPQANF